jgi:tetratricopeptide (TPR) repeat protein
MTQPPDRGFIAWARIFATVFIAALLVVAVVVLWGRDLGLRHLAYEALRKLATPEVMQTWEARGANRRAFAAQREGDAHYAARDYEAAVRSFSRAIELFGPDKATAAWSYHRRASALERAGRKQDALADYDKAIALQPNFTISYRYRGILLSDLGRHDDALRDLATALERNPNSADTLIDRGRVLEKISRRDDALADYAQAIVAAHKTHDGLIARGDEAMRSRRSRERDRTIARAHTHRGNVFRTTEQSDEALAEYAKALELRPDDGFIYVSRGWLHEKQGRRDLARTDYEKAASLAPPSDWLKRALERTR